MAGSRTTRRPPVRPSPAGGRPWLRLLIGAALVFLAMFGIGALTPLIPGAERMGRIIEERDLRATAIYYTDLKESAEGSEYIRDCLESAPDRP